MDPTIDVVPMEKVRPHLVSGRALKWKSTIEQVFARISPEDAVVVRGLQKEESLKCVGAIRATIHYRGKDAFIPEGYRLRTRRAKENDLYDVYFYLSKEERV